MGGLSLRICGPLRPGNMNSDNWRESAFCKGMNKDSWRNVSKGFCKKCDVVDECLWSALSEDDYHMTFDARSPGARSSFLTYNPHLVRGGVLATERKRVFDLCKGDTVATFEILKLGRIL